MNFKQFLHKINLQDTKLLPSFSTVTKIFYVCVVIAITISVTKSIFAETKIPETNQYIIDKQNAIKSGNNQESWLNEAMGSNMISTFHAISGGIPDEVLKGEINPDGTPKSYIPGGALGITNNLVASLYNQPASGIEYLAQVKNEFLGKPAYAQGGVGFNGLRPILSLWRGFRNTIYILTSIFFIITGIMMMLRVKISPQAVVTVQNAIPKIITTLILVTFSYAIAGLLIDLANFFQAIVLAILFQNSEVTKGLLSGNLYSHGYNPTFNELSNASFSTTIQLAFKAVPFLTLMSLGALPGIILGLIFIPFTGVLGGLGVGVAGAILGPILVAILVSLLMLWWTIKFFFGLIKCYVNIILKIILAPLEIGMGAIPNMKMGFTSWITNLIANLAVFPLSILFLVLANIIIDAVTYQRLWYPSLLEVDGLISATSRLTAFYSGGFVAVGIGLGVMSLLSKLPTMIPEFIFQLKPSPWGKAIGESFKPITGYAGKAAAGGVMSGSTKLDEAYLTNVRGGRPTTAGQNRAHVISQGLKRIFGKSP